MIASTCTSMSHSGSTSRRTSTPVEFIYRHWVVDIEDVEPEVVDRSLTDGIRILRRGTLVNARRIQCELEGEDAVACIQLGRRMMCRSRGS